MADVVRIEHWTGHDTVAPPWRYYPDVALWHGVGAGAAVLVISQDLDELAEIADRIAVMFHGRLSAPLDAAAASREKLGLLMGGSSAGHEEAAHAAGA